MELDHLRLVFRTDRADQHLFAVLHLSRMHVLRRIGTDRCLRKVNLLHLRSVDHHPRIQRQQPIGRRQQRIDVDFLDPLLFGDQHD